MYNSECNLLTALFSNKSYVSSGVIDSLYKLSLNDLYCPLQHFHLKVTNTVTQISSFNSSSKCNSGSSNSSSIVIITITILLPVGLVEICKLASCVCGRPQIHHRLFPGQPVSPFRDLVLPKTASLCHTHAMNNSITHLFHRIFRTTLLFDQPGLALNLCNIMQSLVFQHITIDLFTTHHGKTIFSYTARKFCKIKRWIVLMALKHGRESRHFNFWILQGFDAVMSVTRRESYL